MIISPSVAAWLFWIIGTILIVSSWYGLVRIELGWFGFAVALLGSVLGHLVNVPESSEGEALDDADQAPEE